MSQQKFSFRLFGVFDQREIIQFFMISNHYVTHQIIHKEANQKLKKN